MTTPPPESSTPLVAPTAEEALAISKSSLNEEIRSLAQQFLKATDLGFDPSTHVKGIVTAISYTSSPPTVSVQISGDTTTTVSGVRIMSNYSPVVGQTVDIRKQGSDILITGHTADVGGSSVGQAGNGWTLATLTNGSHNGNSNGSIYYRLILDHGAWKMQWRGGWSVNGTLMIDTPHALATQYRPSSKRSILAARQMQTGATAVQFDFHTDGRVEMVGHNATPGAAVVSGDVTFASPGGFVDSSGNHNHLDGNGFLTTTDGVHTHSYSAGHDHGFFGGSHTHAVTTPSWVSLNGVEYFL